MSRIRPATPPPETAVAQRPEPAFGVAPAGSGGVLLRVLDHPAVITLAIFLVVVMTCLPGGLMANTLETLIYAKHWIDADFIANDWRLGLHPGPRLPFVLIVGPLLKVASIEQLNIYGSAAGYLLLAAGLGMLFARLGLSALEAVAVVTLFIFAGQSVAAREGIFSMLESKTFAYALVFAALALAVRHRIVLASGALGLAATMHVLVGGWAAICFAIATLTMRQFDVRQRVLAAGAFLVGALPGLAALVAAHTPDPVALPAGVTPEYIYVFMRAPHHVSPRAMAGFVLGSPQRQLVLAFAAGVALALMALLRFVNTADARLLVARFLLASLIPVAVGGIAAFVPGGERFLRYYPFRLADTLLPLLGTAVLVAFALPLLASRRSGLAIRMLFAVLAAAWLVKEDPGRRLRMGSERPPPGFAAAAQFIREHAPAGEPILVSPHIDFAGYWMERPVIGSWKFVPHDRAGLAEWYYRMVDLRVIYPPDSTTRRPQRHYAHAFDTMSTEEYVAVAEKYGTAYLVTRRRPDITLPIAFDSDPFAVYVVRPVEH